MNAAYLGIQLVLFGDCSMKTTISIPGIVYTTLNSRGCLHVLLLAVLCKQLVPPVANWIIIKL